MGTAVKHPVPERVKPSFVTSGHSNAQGWVSECSNVKNYKWRLNPVWHRMLYNCTHTATVSVKGWKFDGDMTLDTVTGKANLRSKGERLRSRRTKNVNSALLISSWEEIDLHQTKTKMILDPFTHIVEFTSGHANLFKICLSVTCLSFTQFATL